MLHSIHLRYGEKLRALDGEIGHVRDFYFDDQNWAVRYVVADTGGWLPGRLVLLSPHAFGELVPEGKTLRINLTRRQIEDSPSIEEHKPVSRQHEEEYHSHYGFPYYAQSAPLWGLAGYPVLVPPPPPNDPDKQAVDAHLRSTRFVKGYEVEAEDGPVGKVDDFMVDRQTWIIRKIAIDCGHWLSQNRLLIPSERVARISYDRSTLYVAAAKAELIERADQPAA